MKKSRNFSKKVKGTVLDKASWVVSIDIGTL